LKKAIESKGGNLAAGFAVKMPYNYIVPSFSFKKCAISVTLKEVPVEEQKKMFSNWSKKREIILYFVHARKKGI
jgi:hypothetical protein